MKKSLLLFTAILTVFLFALPVYAADITLSSSCSLADAIIAVNHDRPEGGCPAGRGADTIALTRDITLDGGLPKITSSITIEGNGYTISGDNRWRIFYNDGGALTIHDLTMTKGRAEGELITNADGKVKNATANPIGGAIVNWVGTVTITDSSFIGNSVEGGGGAIANWMGTLTISDSVFSDNSAEEGGGGAIVNSGELSISDSSFSGNSAEVGGAVYNGEELSIVNSVFSDNSADKGGSAIANGGNGELNIVNSSFSDNSADDDGGAIYNWQELSIDSNTFSGNSADRGGAIANAGEFSITNSTFSGNKAEGVGGAIYNSDGGLSISDSSFSGNKAERSGNSAGLGGGAIANLGELSITNSTFSGNSADDDGGAILNGLGTVAIKGSTFSGNSAYDGGAIYNWEEGGLSLINSIIAGRGGTCYSDSRLRQNISNFIQDGSCSPAVRGNPMLGELVEPADGSPAYFPLLAGSRAIDAADDGYCPATDQIGTVRPQGAGCDIGAIEYVAP